MILKNLISYEAGLCPVVLLDCGRLCHGCRLAAG